MRLPHRCTQYRAAVIDEAVGERLATDRLLRYSPRRVRLVEVKVAANHVYLVVEVAPQLGVHPAGESDEGGVIARCARNSALRSRIATVVDQLCTTSAPWEARRRRRWSAACPRSASRDSRREPGPRPAAAMAENVDVRRMTARSLVCCGYVRCRDKRRCRDPGSPPAVAGGADVAVLAPLRAGLPPPLAESFTLRLASMEQSSTWTTATRSRRSSPELPAKFHAGEANSMLTGPLGPDFGAGWSTRRCTGIGGG